MLRPTPPSPHGPAKPDLFGPGYGVHLRRTGQPVRVTCSYVGGFFLAVLLQSPPLCVGSQWPTTRPTTELIWSVGLSNIRQVYTALAYASNNKKTLETEATGRSRGDGVERNKVPPPMGSKKADSTTFNPPMQHEVNPVAFRCGNKTMSMLQCLPKMWSELEYVGGRDLKAQAIRSIGN